MSDNKHNKDQFFSNEATLLRRAWIEAAVNGVRARLDVCPEAEDFQPWPLCQPRGLTVVPEQIAPEPASNPASRSRPTLYVAWPLQERRSRA